MAYTESFQCPESKVFNHSWNIIFEMCNTRLLSNNNTDKNEKQLGASPAAILTLTLMSTFGYSILRYYE